MNWQIREKKIIHSPCPRYGRKERMNQLLKINFVLVMWGCTQGQLGSWMKNFKVGTPMQPGPTASSLLCGQALCEGLIIPFIYICRWPQRSLTNCRVPLLSPAAPICSIGKDEAAPRQIWTMHGTDTWHSLVAQPTPVVPWRICACSRVLMVSDVSPNTQGKKEQVTKMLVATPVGQKDLTRM